MWNWQSHGYYDRAHINMLVLVWVETYWYPTYYRMDVYADTLLSALRITEFSFNFLKKLLGIGVNPIAKKHIVCVDPIITNIRIFSKVFEGQPTWSDWSGSSLGAQVILLVLLCSSSFHRVSNIMYAQLQNPLIPLPWGVPLMKTSIHFEFLV